ncbi:MAG TPA: glycosyltransferase [Candidatus Binatia bacterium]|nr:glycosyltransferase [Candidatus Binatia bacterium]
MEFALVVPTLNAGALVRDLFGAIRTQTARAVVDLLLDSTSDDQTPDLARASGAQVLNIPRADFDHGATRQLALDHIGDVPIVVFLTQDAIPADANAFERLVAAFDDATVAAAYGRQLPRDGAGVAEAHARLFNYPSESFVKSLADAARLGIKTPFLSNSFAAYRVSALREAGGFPRRTLFGEDMYVAAKLLLAGHRIAYVADATVWHSHSYSLGAEFRRYFDVGAFHARNPWIMQKFGRAGSEGRAYVRSELGYAAKRAPAAIPGLLLRDALKLLGMQVGKREALLPRRLKARLSMNPRFWDTEPA